MLMSNTEILDSIVKQTLTIDNFERPLLQGSSYDARVGAEAVTGSTRDVLNLQEHGDVIIAPGDFGLILTYEHFKLPVNIAGHIGMRSDLMRRGLLSLAGLQIDPGFSGKLVVGVCNLGSREVRLRYKDPFVSIEFLKLATSASIAYSGPSQDQTSILPKDIERLTPPLITAQEQIRIIQQLVQSVDHLTEVIKKLSERVESPSK